MYGCAGDVAGKGLERRGVHACSLMRELARGVIKWRARFLRALPACLACLAGTRPWKRPSE